MRVWVTRPQAQAEKTAQKIQQLGMTPWIQPVMKICPLEQAHHMQAIQRCMASLNHYHGAIFISQNAVNFSADWVKKSWPQWPSHVQMFAIGAATANALKESFNVLTQCEPHHAMNSEALLQTPWMDSVAQRKILIFRGQGGRDHLKSVLETRGASVDYCELYCRTVNPNIESVLKRVSEERLCDRLLAYSGESAEYLAQVIGNTGWQSLLHCPLVVPGPRVAQVAKSLGFTSVYMAENASDDAMLACLEKIQ